ncbi:glycosyltransferase [Ammoniphilus oxalaticus]|uniref:glycosyltransferase n=1 Tax=Ammoniphilus oxalaticus TaxID=66863 RepID=UPI001474E806|nr:glycosyltransferase [Ammoniphilus oxalaticus]
MTSFFQLLATIIFVVWVCNFLIHWFGLKRLPRLPIVYRALRDEPFVSVIIAAKDEAPSIAQTMKRLLAQQYGKMELIVVNDRSTDQTGLIAEQTAAQATSGMAIKIIHIDHLPNGWLGKNNALQTGYKQARGDYLLFTDADARFHPDTIRSAISYTLDHQLDHLTLAPFMKARGFWLRGFVHYFMFSLSMVKWPWLPNNDRQRKSGYGIGAFNLLSRNAYEQIGKHEAIAMRPDDDLQLGAKVKQAGLKQRFLVGKQLLEVEWYPSLRDAIVGLEKNMFAGLRYSIPLLIGAILGKLIFYFLPFIAIWFATGWTLLAYGVTIGLILILYTRYTYQMSGERAIEVIVIPLLILLFLFVTIRSCLLTLNRGGMYWRGTFYTLDELRKQQK